MNTTKIGEFIARFMEQLEHDWEDGCTILDVALIVDFERADGEEIILTGCTDKRWWVQTALVEEALDALDSLRSPVADDE